MLVGFTGMYRSKDLTFETYEDLAGNGVDVYDGLSVPMVAPFSGDRRILSGWLRMNGWGGVLCVRELVWFDDAVPGIRWLEDAMPEHAPVCPFDKENDFSGEGYFEFQCTTGEDLFVELTGKGKPVQLKINAASKRASVSTEEHCLTLCERGKQWRKVVPDGFAVDHLRNIDEPYKVRMMIRDERKWGGCIVDVEIAGCRTLIHYFSDTHLTHCKVLCGISDFCFGKLFH